MDGPQSSGRQTDHPDEQTDTTAASLQSDIYTAAEDPEDKMRVSGTSDDNDVFSSSVDVTPPTSTLRQRAASREEGNAINGTEPCRLYPDARHHHSGSGGLAANPASSSAAAKHDPDTAQQTNAARGAAERFVLPTPPGVVLSAYQERRERTKTFRIADDSSFGQLARQLSNGNKYRLRDEKDGESPSQKPKHYFDLAVVTTCCFVSPLGIVAIIMAVLSNSNQKAGHRQRSIIYSRLALTFSILGMISTIVIAVTLIMLYRYPWNEVTRP